MPWLPDQLEQAWPSAGWRDAHVVAAVSGGADSVALLRAMHEAKQRCGGRGRLFVAHFDHRLRGDQSDADAEWVRQLAADLDLEAHIGRAVDAPTSEQHARDARYRWLLSVAEREGARAIATGHTADDQTETILHRLLRGSSLSGLAGIPFSRQLGGSTTLVRPLLGVERRDVERYLASIGQAFRTDATNRECEFTRNRLRNRVLPLLRAELGDSVDDAIRRAGRHAGEAHAVIEGLAAGLAISAISTQASGALRIDCQRLEGHPALVCREACKLAWRQAGWPEQDMGAREWERLHALLASGAGRGTLNLPGGVRARRAGGAVWLVRRA